MKRRVALIIETSSIYGREILAGIVKFMRLHDQWSVYLEQRDLWQKPPKWLLKWNGDGIISRATTPTLISAIEESGIPFVEVTDRHGESSYPNVRSNDEAIGCMAANYLLERGFERFGFCGFSGEAWSQRRESAFAETILAETGQSCASFNSIWQSTANPWDAEKERIKDWLAQLQPPCAIMACNDIRGQHVLDVCLSAGLQVPEQVAVVGVDNDELLCQVSTPPLSSVIPNARLVGYEAAQTLAQIMDHPDEQYSTVSPVDPIGIVTRQSTDIIAISNRELAGALHYIRQHACQGICVDDVVQHSTLSRSTLERQIRKHLGRSPAEEIRHVQVKRAQELLRTSDLTIEHIAELCGFEHPEYLHVVFKRVTGTTMGSYRSQNA